MLIIFFRGQIFLLCEELASACEDFKKAHQLSPKNPLTYVHLLYAAYRQAIVEQDNAKLFQKIEEFTVAVKEYPQCVEVYSLFAQVLSDQQQFQLADDYFEKAMQIEPTNGMCVWLSAQNYFQNIIICFDFKLDYLCIGVC